MITWNVDPVLLHLGPIQIRWYGALFGLSFILGTQILRWIFNREKVPLRHVDGIFFTIMISTILGARLGHCLFYEPEIYLNDPIRILRIWEGGLASHGAAFGILLAIWIYSRRHREFSYLYLLDHIMLSVALSTALIRLGNLMNSEILGYPTHLPWAFIFTRVDQVPRHPAQLYESLAYFSVLFVLWRAYLVENIRNRRGYLFGIFCVLATGARFLLEFLKERQVAFEHGLPIDMGQLLSVPFILVGIWLILRARRLPPAKSPAD